MAKYALLIGVSEFPPGLKSLPSVVSDVNAMEEMLRDAEIGDFTNVKQLLNPKPQPMREAIEELFANREREDLLLLYFSGHGITDENGRLYLSTHETRKNANGELIKATAVEARIVQDRMTESRSRQQVLILDCCYSGAFAEGMSAKDDGVVDIKNQLGSGQGRAVLTSSTSIQYSFEGVYTQYLVEGLRTGAADKDQDGEISVDELHNYAKTKVQESGQAMNPQIYAVKEGYKITIAKAPVNDNKLEYRREVDYWISVTNIPITQTGRIALDALRDKFSLSANEAAEIESIAYKPHLLYLKKLEQYKEACVEEFKNIQPSNSITEKNRQNLKRVQEILGIKNEDANLIEIRTLEEKRKIINPVNKKIKFIFFSLGVTGVFGAGFLFGKIINFLSVGQPILACTTDAFPGKKLRISLGEQVLLNGDTNNYKLTGVGAFIKKDYRQAFESFTSYRTQGKKCISDPEALIYLNNAKALQTSNSLGIAVSVPIGSNQNVAKEILRGVAQAQSELNRHSGINGRLLQVKIANDDNDPRTAVDVATQLAQDQKVLAVIGHNASNASIAAAPVYNKERLVAISPTSYAKNLANLGSYAYRMTPPVEHTAIALSTYITNRAGKKSILLCSDMDVIDSFQSEFKKAIGNKLNPTECEISKKDEVASETLSRAIKNGADGIVFVPYVDRIKNALEIARKVSNKHISLFGSFTLYTSETLQNGKSDVNNLIVATPWHPKIFPNNFFPREAMTLWGGSVNWRTAMAYDGTMIIAKALRQNPTRKGVQNFLRSGGFFDGATGKVNFLESGDRETNVLRLIQVQPNSQTQTGYEFVLLPG
jgi:branched-chain amino acid transport system substrate-binding protein